MVLCGPKSFVTIMWARSDSLQQARVRMSVLVRGLVECRRGRQTRRLESWYIQRSMNIPFRLTHRYQVAGWQGPAMRRRASGRLGPAIHSPMQTPSWLVRNIYYINEADRDRGLRPFHGPVPSSTKLIVAAGSLPFHGPEPSTIVFFFRSTNTRVEIHLPSVNEIHLLSPPRGTTWCQR